MTSFLAARSKPVQRRAPSVVQIGVMFRTDSKGSAHTEHDMKAIFALNQMRNAKDNALFPFTVTPVTLPRDAKGCETPVRKALWSDLDDIDLLYIPGAPTANDTQEGSSSKGSQLCLEEHNFNRLIEPVQPTSWKAQGQYEKQLESYKRRHQEHSSRAEYELLLLGIARNRGIPVLAVCAGSWRLLESYGGKVRTLEVTVRNKHKAADPRNTWTLQHALRLLGGRTLIKLMIKKGVALSDGGVIAIQNVNSTHWAVASTDQTKLASGSGDPSKLLEISAIDPDTDTVEAFESLYGAPVMGIQWHPESYLPGMPGEDSDSAGAPLVSKTIFEFMTFAAATSRQRRALIPTLNNEARAFDLLSECARLLAAQKIVGAANLFREANSLLPKDKWSARMHVINDAIDTLGAYYEKLDANRMVAADLYRAAQTRLREYGVTI